MMTPEQKRIKIAELCGWSHWFNGWNKLNDNTTPLTLTENLPNYLNDLNAMHEAEEQLNADQCAQFVKELAKHDPTFCIMVLNHQDPNDWECEHFKLIHATASQRADAFLLTNGIEL